MYASTKIINAKNIPYKLEAAKGWFRYFYLYYTSTTIYYTGKTGATRNNNLKGFCMRNDVNKGV